MKKIIVQMVMMLIMIGVLSGCSFIEQTLIEEDVLMVYFYNEQTERLEGEEVLYAQDENTLSEEKLIAVIEALYKGPQTKGQINKPIDFHIKEASLKGNRAYIDFGEAYNQLSVKNQMIYRASLVWSITDIAYINDVEFSVEGEALRTNSGARIGAIERSDILITALDPSPPTSIQTITLYFAKQGEDKLYSEQRTIQVNHSIPLEEYIIDELIKGPQSEDLLPVLPADTKDNSIKTQEGICQVDLSYDLNTAQNTSAIQESLVIYSLVNSLTELSNIQKVSFLKDGQKQAEFSTDIMTGGTFERNEEIIADVQ